MNTPKFFMPKNTPLKSLVINGRAVDYLMTQQDCTICDDNIGINHETFIVASWRYGGYGAVSMFIEKKHLIPL